MATDKEITKVNRERRGKAMCLTLETEAVTILQGQCANGKAYGKHVSDLLRQEEARRIEARRLRKKLAAVADDVR